MDHRMTNTGRAKRKLDYDSQNLTETKKKTQKRARRTTYRRFAWEAFHCYWQQADHGSFDDSKIVD
eukprot:12291904-Prorocentrum_lima.AAC.1